MTEASKGCSHWGELIYPTVEKVLEDYADVIGIPPETAQRYVRDWNTFRSTLQRPRQAAHYEGAGSAGIGAS